MRRRDSDLIEAHHLGGHSWVAYGWDEPSASPSDLMRLIDAPSPNFDARLRRPT